MDLLNWLFDSSPWPPRWQCGTWSLTLGWGTILSNWLIALSYWLIPLGAYWLLRKRPALAPHPTLVTWCLAFVVLCGTTHALDGLVYWWPAYRLNFVVRSLTAVVSVGTLILFIKVRKQLLDLPTPQSYKQAIDERDKMYLVADQRLKGLNVLLHARTNQNAALREELDAMRDTIAQLQVRAQLQGWQQQTADDLKDLRHHLHAIRDKMQ